MSKIKIMIPFMFLCLILFSFAGGEDRWREHIQKRLVRAAETDFSFWQNFLWGRSTTRRTSSSATTITTTSTKPPTTSVTGKVTSAATGSPSSSFTTLQNEALAQTNTHRAAHCARDIILNSTLNNVAQTYANKLAALNIFEHSGGPYGENLYYTGSSQAIDINTIKGSAPIDDWYKEVALYNWSKPGFSASAGHFTQLVWINTQQFGIGIACTTKKTRCYVVANYSPRGNDGDQNQYKINVKQGPPCT